MAGVLQKPHSGSCDRLSSLLPRCSSTSTQPYIQKTTCLFTSTALAVRENLSVGTAASTTVLSVSSWTSPRLELIREAERNAELRKVKRVSLGTFSI